MRNLETPHLPEQETTPEPETAPQTELREKHEQPETVMERAKEQRLELFKKVFLSRAMQAVDSPLFLKILNYMPVVGEVKQFAGAVRGQEGGRQLSAKERLSYLTAVSMNVLSWIHASQGNLSAAGLEQTIAFTLVNLDTLPVILKSTAETLSEKSPKLAGLINGTSDYLAKKREELASIGELFKNNGLTTLGPALSES